MNSNNKKRWPDERWILWGELLDRLSTLEGRKIKESVRLWLEYVVEDGILVHGNKATEKAIEEDFARRANTKEFWNWWKCWAMVKSTMWWYRRRKKKQSIS